MKKAVLKSMLFVFLLALSSCMAAPTHVRPPLEYEGEIFFYIKPFPQEADRLTFSLAAVSAVRDDGQEFPLSLRLAEMKGKEIMRQRLLCEGMLPEGSYAGFSFQIAKASLQGEEGEADLLPPEGPARVDFPFRVTARKASFMLAGFDYARSVINEFSFTPVFTFAPSPKPVTAVLGYASNSGAYALTVFDKNAMQAVGAAATARQPKGIALDQKQRRVYAAMPAGDFVAVIDATTLETLQTLQLHPGDRPEDLALTADGKALFTVNGGSNTVSVFDTSLLIETTRIPIGIGPTAILMDRAGRRAYVFNTFSNSISIIDVANRSLAASLSTDPAPLWGQFNAKGDKLYIIFEQSPYMTVLNPLTLTILARPYVGLGMSALKVDIATDLIYVGKRNDAVVEVYDPFSLISFDYISVGEGAAYLTIDGEGNNLWVVGSVTGKLTSVSLASKKVVSEIDIGAGASRIVMMGER